MPAGVAKQLPPACIWWYAPNAFFAVALFLRSRCSCGRVVLAVALFLRSRCSCGRVVLAVALFLRSRYFRSRALLATNRESCPMSAPLRSLEQIHVHKFGGAALADAAAIL